MSLADLLQPRLTELGKIKIGGKGAEITSQRGNKFRPPTKLDHFIVTTLHRDNTGSLVNDDELMKRLAAKYGDNDGKLRQIPIRLLSNDIEEVLQAAWVWYGGKTCGARSDGKRVTWFNDRRNGQRLKEPLEEDWKEEYEDLKASNGAPLFKLHTMLSCIIADEDSRWGGVYKFRTTSRITADQLYGSLVHLGTLTGGMLMGLPLRLVVRPLQVAPDGKPTTVYVVHVELRGPDLQAIQAQALQLAQFQVNHRQQINQLQAQYRKLLPGPGQETDPADIADAADEFHPENTGTLAAADTTDPVLAGQTATTPAQTQTAPATDPVIDADYQDYGQQDLEQQAQKPVTKPVTEEDIATPEAFYESCNACVIGTDWTPEDFSKAFAAVKLAQPVGLANGKGIAARRLVLEAWRAGRVGKDGKISQ